MMANDRGSYQSSDFVRSLLPMCRNEAFGYPRRRHDGGILSDIKCDKEKFQVNLDIQDFRPCELSVRTKVNFLVIEGNREVVQNGLRFTSRHFENRYLLPENALPKELHYNFRSDGVLQVEVARHDSLRDSLSGDHYHSS